MAVFYLKIKPNAPRSALTRAPDGTLVLRIAAPPTEGKANAAITAFLAKDVFGVPKSAVEIVGGHTGPLKKISVDGLTAAEVAARLAP